MASTIKVKRSAVQGKAPTTGNLETGELALNTRDGRLYSKGTQVFEVGANTHSLFVGAGGATFANGAYTFPTADGSANQVLQTDGNGTLSFANNTGGAGGTFTGSVPFYEYDGTLDTVPLSNGGELDPTALANTNAYIATVSATERSALANTNAYIATVSATERSALANTNAYIATKLNTSSYTEADVQSKAALANTNAYIATKLNSSSYTEADVRSKAALANTNAYIATKLDSSSYTTADVQSKAALANTNAYIATKLDTSSYTTADVQSKAALANTNAYIATRASEADSLLRLANTNAYIATKLNSSSYTEADVRIKSALANTNAFIATKTTESTALSRLANTNAYIATKVSQSGANNSAKIPYGTTAERDGSPDTGFFRYNVTTASAEIYDGSAWGEVGGGGGASGAGGDAIFYENGQTITTSYTITTNTNAMSTGPLTVNSGVSVTVPSGSRWVVL